MCLIICRVRHLSDELRYDLLPFLVNHATDRAMDAWK